MFAMLVSELPCEKDIAASFSFHLAKPPAVPFRTLRHSPANLPGEFLKGAAGDRQAAVCGPVTCRARRRSCVAGRGRHSWLPVVSGRRGGRRQCGRGASIVRRMTAESEPSPVPTAAAAAEAASAVSGQPAAAEPAEDGSVEVEKAVVKPQEGHVNGHATGAHEKTAADKVSAGETAGVHDSDAIETSAAGPHSVEKVAPGSQQEVQHPRKDESAARSHPPEKSSPTQPTQAAPQPAAAVRPSERPRSQPAPPSAPGSTASGAGQRRPGSLTAQQLESLRRQSQQFQSLRAASTARSTASHRPSSASAAAAAAQQRSRGGQRAASVVPRPAPQEVRASTLPRRQTEPPRAQHRPEAVIAPTQKPPQPRARSQSPADEKMGSGRPWFRRGGRGTPLRKSVTYGKSVEELAVQRRQMAAAAMPQPWMQRLVSGARRDQTAGRVTGTVTER